MDKWYKTIAERRACVKIGNHLQCVGNYTGSILLGHKMEDDCMEAREGAKNVLLTGRVILDFMYQATACGFIWRDEVTE